MPRSFLSKVPWQQWLKDVIHVESVTAKNDESTLTVVVHYIVKRSQESLTAEFAKEGLEVQTSAEATPGVLRSSETDWNGIDYLEVRTITENSVSKNPLIIVHCFKGSVRA